MTLPHPILSFTSPIQLEYMSGWTALGIFGVLALFFIGFGIRSMSGLGASRKWVSIIVRLLVLALFVLILGGVRWQRVNRDVEVIVLKDISHSTRQFRGFEGKSLDASINDWLRTVSDSAHKEPKDRIGLISFSEDAQIDAMPNTTLDLNSKPIQQVGEGTDIAAAMQLALATFHPDAMHKLVLITDGNANTGDTDQAIKLAASQHVPIDVVPLKYNVDDAVLMGHFQAPSWKHVNEPFTITVFLESTDPNPVTGELSVTMKTGAEERALKLTDDPNNPTKTSKTVTLQHGLNPVPITVPGLDFAGVREFKAVFDNPSVRVSSESSARARADAFTFVLGKGEILYVDNTTDTGGDHPGHYLAEALDREGIRVKTITVNQFPTSLVEMQNYDAVILANVPYGSSGLNQAQEEHLANYVHDMGGGLVMIGGENSFGAGAWQGTKLEEVLPVNMDIPAQRQMPKGALVLVMHSCEMPNGNYWGEQCALQAIKTLSSQDEIGVISYGHGIGGGGGIGGAQWDFALKNKGDGSQVEAAVKNMALGDMPSFDDSINLAVNGVPGSPGLINSTARQKHIIAISDGDPAGPIPSLIAACQNNKISISTVTVYPHQVDPVSGVAPVMRDMADQTKGRHYGPIEANPNQLPQIFIKEATVVRRSLIYEDKAIPVKIINGPSELIKGIGAFPALRGMVLTSRKSAPQVDIPLVAGKNNDPLLAQWQAGLGRSVVFTSDAHNKWAVDWMGEGLYQKFWAQTVRSVSRPPMSSDFDVQVKQGGGKGHVDVEALKKDAGFLSFLTVKGTVVGPNGDTHPVRLVQTGPGQYSADFDAKDEGNYVVVLDYNGNGSDRGVLVGGTTVNDTPEMRDLKSNDTMLEQVADETGGRVLEPFDISTNLFSREHLVQSASPVPVWDQLIPILLALILLDVAVRRIAWDLATIKRAWAATAQMVRNFTVTTRKVESRETMDALKRVRGEVADTKFKPAEGKAPTIAGTPAPAPDRSAKFEASQTVEGDISSVVGGASDKPLPPAPKKIQPKGAPAGPGEHTGSLLEAKRRAQQQIRQKEEGKDK